MGRKPVILETNTARSRIVKNRAFITREALAGHTAAAIWRALGEPGSLVNFQRWVSRFKAEASEAQQRDAVSSDAGSRRRKVKRATGESHDFTRMPSYRHTTNPDKEDLY